MPRQKKSFVSKDQINYRVPDNAKIIEFLNNQENITQTLNLLLMLGANEYGTGDLLTAIAENQAKLKKLVNAQAEELLKNNQQTIENDVSNVNDELDSEDASDEHRSTNLKKKINLDMLSTEKSDDEDE